MHIKHLDICRQKRLSAMAALALAASEGAEPCTAGGSPSDGWDGQLWTLLKSDVN